MLLTNKKLLEDGVHLLTNLLQEQNILSVILQAETGLGFSNSTDSQRRFLTLSTCILTSSRPLSAVLLIWGLVKGPFKNINSPSNYS